MAAAKSGKKPAGHGAKIEAVASILEGYAQRGVFRGFSPVGEPRQGRAAFRLSWHRDTVFDFIYDATTSTMRFPVLLPNVPTEMHADLKAFIAGRQAADVPAHRRIDSRKVRITTARRAGNVALSLRALDGDDDYGARKLIHLVHEIFLTFLLDGRYYDYMVENFDLDPDRL